MNTSTHTLSAAQPQAHSVGFALPRSASSSARAALQLLQRLQEGTLILELPDGSVQRFGQSGELHASLKVKEWRVFDAVMRSGDIGLGETYGDGAWHTPDLGALLHLFVRNRRHLEDAVYGSWWGRLVYRLRHVLNRNSKANSRRNIHAHYDLGNAFYELWLDETMNYSSALFESPTQPMPEAQRAKVRRALTEAGVKAGDRVLEIGCGWGALAEMATTEFDARITGVTLSTEQLAFANRRMERLETAGSADLRLQDYRDIADGPYDAICSIEMVEAVGREYWPTYFQAVNRLLKPGGKACIQSITIDDALFDRYISGTDFIQQFIFPGGCLPSPSQFRQQAEAAGLEVVNDLSFGCDYALTLRLWREIFMSKLQAVKAQGFDERFIRLWEFYLAYCEAAFEGGNTDVMQFTLRKPTGKD